MHRVWSIVSGICAGGLDKVLSDKEDMIHDRLSVDGAAEVITTTLLLPKTVIPRDEIAARIRENQANAGRLMQC